MPIYEYRCRHCNQSFEQLLRSEKETASCPKCQGKELDKLYSSFATSSDGGSHVCSSGGCCGGAPNISGGCPGGMCGL